MQDGQCQTGDMDMDAAIKVRSHGVRRWWRGGLAQVRGVKDMYPAHQMRATTPTTGIID